MGDSCFYCIYFDSEETDLPICTLRQKLIDDEWVCGDYEPIGELDDDTWRG